jgi:hypothetical protein
MNNPWIKIVPPSKDVNALRADAEHPLDLFWAKDHFGRYLFVYEYPATSKVLIKDPINLVGIETMFMKATNGISRLVLILKDKTNWELFYALCNDLITTTKTIKIPEQASATIIHRLRKWQEFLKKERLNILSEEKIKGLIGELIFLKNHLLPKIGGADAVKFWIGPEGAPQDFNINKCGVEVKCQLGGTKPYVKINSAEQLYSQFPRLFLYVVTLGKTTLDNPKAINLPNIVENIAKVLELVSSQALERFQDLLMEAGYYFSEKYLDFNYLFLDEHVFTVIDGFPRICPSDLSTGIIKLTYYINLSDCRPFEIEIKNWEFK